MRIIVKAVTLVIPELTGKMDFLKTVMLEKKIQDMKDALGIPVLGGSPLRTEEDVRLALSKGIEPEFKVETRTQVIMGGIRKVTVNEKDKNYLYDWPSQRIQRKNPTTIDGRNECCSIEFFPWNP